MSASPPHPCSVASRLQLEICPGGCVCTEKWTVIINRVLSFLCLTLSTKLAVKCLSVRPWSQEVEFIPSSVHDWLNACLPMSVSSSVRGSVPQSDPGAVPE